jgi:hypothetical protein
MGMLYLIIIIKKKKKKKDADDDDNVGPRTLCNACGLVYAKMVSIPLLPSPGTRLKPSVPVSSHISHIICATLL